MRPATTTFSRSLWLSFGGVLFASLAAASSCTLSPRNGQILSRRSEEFDATLAYLPDSDATKNTRLENTLSVSILAVFPGEVAKENLDCGVTTALDSRVRECRTADGLRVATVCLERGESGSEIRPVTFEAPLPPQPPSGMAGTGSPPMAGAMSPPMAGMMSPPVAGTESLPMAGTGGVGGAADAGGTARLLSEPIMIPTPVTPPSPKCQIQVEMTASTTFAVDVANTGFLSTTFKAVRIPEQFWRECSRICEGETSPCTRVCPEGAMHFARIQTAVVYGGGVAPRAGDPTLQTITLRPFDADDATTACIRDRFGREGAGAVFRDCRNQIEDRTTLLFARQ